jgi:hypothetical protein
MTRDDDAAFELSTLLLSRKGAERKSRRMIAQDAAPPEQRAVAHQVYPVHP